MPLGSSLLDREYRPNGPQTILPHLQAFAIQGKAGRLTGFSVEGALNRYVLGLEEPRPADGKWHPSSIFGCSRKALYEMLGTVKSNPHDARASRVFRMGHIIHELVQAAIAADPLVVAFYPEIAVDSPTLGITGHSDGLIAYAGDEESAQLLRDRIAEDGWMPWEWELEGLISWNVLEFKSMNSNSFKYGDLPKEDHAHQTFTYMKALREEGGTSETWGETVVIPPLGDQLSQGRIAYVSKDDMKVEEFVVLWSDAKNERFMAYLAELEHHRAAGTLPDRLPFVAGPKSAPKPRRDYRCSYCPFMDTCWEEFTQPDITTPQ